MRSSICSPALVSRHLKELIIHYQNHAIDTAAAIQQLSELDTDQRDAHRHGENLGLTDDELAFYGALELNKIAVKLLAAFGVTLRTETNSETLRDRVLAVVQETMEPEHVSL